VKPRCAACSRGDPARNGERIRIHAGARTDAGVHRARSGGEILHTIEPAEGQLLASSRTSCPEDVAISASTPWSAVPRQAQCHSAPLSIPDRDAEASAPAHQTLLGEIPRLDVPRMRAEASVLPELMTLGFWRPWSQEPTPSSRSTSGGCCEEPPLLHIGAARRAAFCGHGAKDRVGCSSPWDEGICPPPGVLGAALADPQG